MYERPKRIAEKAKAIRKHLGISQSGMLHRLNLKCCYGRVSEYERGKRQPSLLTLLDCARAGNVSLESLVDDEMDLSFYPEAASRRL